MVWLGVAVVLAACGEAASDTDAADEEPTGPQYAGETVLLEESWTIPEGETVRVGPGTTFEAASGVAIRVEGSLIVEGDADSPVAFLGGDEPRSWEGLVVASGGYLELTHARIAGATYGIHAMPGSDFSVDYADIGTSFKAAVIESDGLFDHTKFHASGDSTSAPTTDASIDDVNGALTIINASPTVKNSTFDNSAPYVNMVQVGGANSQPTFDHIAITDGHCGIHVYGQPDNPPVITNAIFEGLPYAVMAFATKIEIRDSVFLDNTNDVGFCFEATDEDAPSLSNNYYSSGLRLDASCTQIGTADDSPAAEANPDAGPVGL